MPLGWAIPAVDRCGSPAEPEVSARETRGSWPLKRGFCRLDG
jgi:hypothetical protein